MTAAPRGASVGSPPLGGPSLLSHRRAVHNEGTPRKIAVTGVRRPYEKFRPRQPEVLVNSGFTLVQLLVSIAILFLITGTAASRFTRYQDRLNAHAAAMDVASALARSRSVAHERSMRAATTFDTASVALAVQSYGDTLEYRPLGALYGVTLTVSRDSVTYAANAMGFGASNSRIIVSRGLAAETVTVSRLGRVRH